MCRIYKAHTNYLVKPEHKEVLDNTFGQDDFNQVSPMDPLNNDSDVDLPVC